MIHATESDADEATFGRAVHWPGATDSRMKRMWQRFAAAAVVALFTTTPASAAQHTVALKFGASGFFEGFGTGAPLPVDPASGSFTLTFDDAIDYDEASSGLTLGTLNFVFDGPLVFSYIAADDILSIGGGCACGASGGLFEIGTNTNDFLLEVVNPAGTAQFYDFAYSQAAFPDVAIANAGYVASVPEPVSWVLLFVGFGATGVALRQRPAPVAGRTA